mmetsp:Transcript_112789/g.224350  ORF Transcript_112789/g.224350 Transcript_112789/m.224350 type:complete len:85 (-) Transcript_112789:666-920(-)
MQTMLVDAGFEDIKIQIKDNSSEIIKDWMPGSGAEKYVTSAYITAVKPANRQGIRDNVRANCCAQDDAAFTSVGGAEAPPAVGC